MGSNVLSRPAFKNSSIYSPLMELVRSQVAPEMYPMLYPDENGWNSWLLRTPASIEKEPSLFYTRGVTKHTKEGLTHIVAAPGRTREDFEVTVKGRLVTVRTVASEGTSKSDSYKWEKEAYDNHDLDAISAKMENGVLELRIPVKEAVEPEVKKIAIG
jgi:hypothetical protein